MADRRSITGHAAAFIAYAIFGFNIIVCKDLTSGHLIPPLGIFTIRSLTAGVLFWIVSAFMPKEKIDRKDYIRIFAASMLGFFTCQVTFLVGIPYITPMDCSILTAMSPIYTMAIAAIAIKEPITLKKATGVAISFAGIIYLIVSRVTAPGGIAESTGTNGVHRNGILAAAVQNRGKIVLHGDSPFFMYDISIISPGRGKGNSTAG